MLAYTLRKSQLKNNNNHRIGYYSATPLIYLGFK